MESIAVYVCIEHMVVVAIYINKDIFPNLRHVLVLCCVLEQLCP